jgi:hypothetical protein
MPYKSKQDKFWHNQRYYYANRERLLAHFRARNRKQRAEWVEEGRCYRCGKPLIEPEEIKYCICCMARNGERIKGRLRIGVYREANYQSAAQ